jgi:hypothetical protein
MAQYPDVTDKVAVIAFNLKVVNRYLLSLILNASDACPLAV